MPSLHGAKWTLIGDSYSKGTVVGFGGNSKMHQGVSRRDVTVSIFVGAWGLRGGFRMWGNVNPIRNFVRRAHGTSVISRLWLDS